MYLNPTPMNPSKDWADRSRDSRSHHKRFVVDVDVTYHWKHSAIKSWNKSKNMGALVPSRGLELWWAGSPTKNPTSWSMISFRVYKPLKFHYNEPNTHTKYSNMHISKGPLVAMGHLPSHLLPTPKMALAIIPFQGCSATLKISRSWVLKQ
jgi:hypothetical protein